MPVQYKNVSAAHIKKCFETAFAAYPALQKQDIHLEQLSIKGFTMRAQPMLNLKLLSQNTRSYRIQMSNHLQIAQYIRPEALPEEVLVGWFAHELGHVMDYHQRSLWGLMKFVLGYIGWPTYRAGAERQADLFAIEAGFGDELMATKIYILEQSTLPDHYKDRIKKYYMSPDELALQIKAEQPARVHF